MSIHYCLSMLTMLTGHGATVSNVPESPRDTSTLTTLPHEDVLDAEVRILRGKYIYIFVRILLIFSFFFSFFFFFFFFFFFGLRLLTTYSVLLKGQQLVALL